MSQENTITPEPEVTEKPVYGAQWSAQDIADMEADARGDDVDLAPPTKAEAGEAPAKEEAQTDAAKPAAQEVEAETTAGEAAPQAASAPQPFVPQYTADAPENADDLIAKLRAEKRAAQRLLLEGDSEMTFEAFAAIEDRVDAEVDRIKAAVAAKKLADSLTEQNQTQYLRNEWLAAQNASFALFKAEGMDYMAEGSRDKLDVFNGFMKTLGGLPSNAHRDSAWFFSEAHKMTKAYLGASAAPVAPTAKPTVTRPAVNRAELPPTLARVPVAAVAGVDVARFAHLDGRSEQEIERAIAKMSEDERRAYYRNE